MKSFKQYITEIFDKPYQYIEFDESTLQYYRAGFLTDSEQKKAYGVELNMDINERFVDLNFYRLEIPEEEMRSMDLTLLKTTWQDYGRDIKLSKSSKTSDLEEASKIFATVIKITKDYIEKAEKKYYIDYMTFYADASEPSRIKFYNILANRLGLKTVITPMTSTTQYKLMLDSYIKEDRNSDLLKEFWNECENRLEVYFERGGCGIAARDLSEFLYGKQINNEIVKTGFIDKNGVKRKGWFQIDEPEYNYDALTQSDISKMKGMRLNPKSKLDIKTYAEQSGLVEDFKLIPHSWVEVNGNILDPSGFYLDGESGQFDKLVQDKSYENLKDRYMYF
jgi:hypothetical protein